MMQWVLWSSPVQNEYRVCNPKPSNDGEEVELAAIVNNKVTTLRLPFLLQKRQILYLMFIDPSYKTKFMTLHCILAIEDPIYYSKS